MGWRRLAPGELDHEALWLGVSVSAAGLAWLWTQLGLPTPACPVQAFTGCPCPTCGATRCFIQLTHGEWLAALRLNPLAGAGFAGVALFDLYALGVLIARAPRFRWTPSPRAAFVARVATVLVLLANWAWLIRDGR